MSGWRLVMSTFVMGAGVSGRTGNTDQHLDCVPRGSDATGEDYPLKKPGLAPLGREIDVHGRSGEVSVQEYVSLLSRLSMPVADGPNDKSPGSRVGYDPDTSFHTYEVAPLISGVSNERSNNKPERFLSGTSSDQVVAQAWNQSRTFAGRVQADRYGEYPGLALWRSPLSTVERNGDVERIDPTVDPRKAFKEWVGGESSPSRRSRRELLMGSSDKSVLDGVLEGFNRLKKDADLPTADRQRLERHATKVRELEKGIDRLKRRMTCDGEFPEGTWASRKDRDQKNGINYGWSYEDLRSELMADIMVRSMACGQTNVGTLCYSLESSRMNVDYLIGDNSSTDGHIHGVGHNENAPEVVMQRVVNWHVDQWVTLLERLAREPAPPPYDDESMLDRSAVVLLFESGVELDGTFRVNHTTDNMVALLGGRAGVGGRRLRGNYHVNAENRMHPCSALMTAMEAVGVRRNEFGELPWQSHGDLFEKA